MEGYKLIKVPGEYIQNYNNAPYIRKPYSYYEQIKFSTYNYRGVKVYIKELLNLDKTNRGYSIEALSIKCHKGKIHYSDVRSVIDGYFDDLEKKINDRPIKCNYILSKLTEEGETLKERSISAMCGKKHSPLEKRYILGDLIKRGMDKVDALDYLNYLL